MTVRQMLLLLVALILVSLMTSWTLADPPSADRVNPWGLVVGQQQDDDDSSDEDTDSGEEEEPSAFEGQKAPESTDTEVLEEELSPKQVRELEEKLQILKDQIFKSRARLKQLRDELFLSSVSVVNAAIYHTQDHGGTFRILSLRYTLDGFEIFNEVNEDGSLEDLEHQQVFEGSLMPGEHLLMVDIYYRGWGYGVFSYLKNYTFHVKSRYSFIVNEGDTFDLNVTAYDEGALMSDLKNSLRIKFIKENREE